MDVTRSTLLVRLADRQDEEAWGIFDQLYRPMLIGYARTRGLASADADDVAQLCIEQVMKHIGNYQHRQPGSFKAWMRTIVDNKIRDMARRRREQPAASGILTRHHDPQPAPDEVWEKHWLIEHLRYCVEQVRPDIAEHTYWAFYYCVIEGVSPQDAAERLGLTATQVYVAKFRVLERVRAMLQDLTGVDICAQLK